MEILIALLLVIVIAFLLLLIKSVGNIATKLEALENKIDSGEGSVTSKSVKPKEEQTRPPIE